GVSAARRPGVADPRPRIVLLEVAVDAVGRPERTGQTVEVGARRDRQHLVVVRRNAGAEILAVITGGDNVSHARRDRVAYRTVERVGIGVTAVAVVSARTGEAHVP